MDTAALIRSMVEEVVLDAGHFVIEVSVSMKRAPFKITVTVDGDEGITIDDCATLSRALSAAFDKREVLDGAYTLEVTTPGLDQPLRLMRQYPKNIGRKLKVKLATGELVGKLVAVSEDVLTIEQETGEGKKREVVSRQIPFSEIEKSFVLVSFK